MSKFSMGRSMSRLSDHRGSLVPLLAIVLFVVVMVLVSITTTARHATDVAKAQWAADAAALAIAAEGPDESGFAVGRAVAEANGARLLGVAITADWPRDPQNPPPIGGSSDPARMSTIVVVDVQRGGFRASASAARFFSHQP